MAVVAVSQHLVVLVVLESSVALPLLIIGAKLLPLDAILLVFLRSLLVVAAVVVVHQVVLWLWEVVHRVLAMAAMFLLEETQAP